MDTARCPEGPARMRRFSARRPSQAAALRCGPPRCVAGHRDALIRLHRRRGRWNAPDLNSWKDNTMSWKLFEGETLLEELRDDAVDWQPGPAETLPTGPREDPGKERPGLRDPGHVRFTTGADVAAEGEYRLVHDDGRTLNLQIDDGSNFSAGEIRARVVGRVPEARDDSEVPPSESI